MESRTGSRSRYKYSIREESPSKESQKALQIARVLADGLGAGNWLLRPTGGASEVNLRSFVSNSGVLLCSAESGLKSRLQLERGIAVIVRSGSVFLPINSLECGVEARTQTQ